MAMVNPYLRGLEEVKEMPGFNKILKAVLRSQIQHMVMQLAYHTQDESIFLTVDSESGRLSQVTSTSAVEFLNDHYYIKEKFKEFCSSEDRKFYAKMKTDPSAKSAPYSPYARSKPSTPAARSAAAKPTPVRSNVRVYKRAKDLNKEQQEVETTTAAENLETGLQNTGIIPESAMEGVKVELNLSEDDIDDDDDDGDADDDFNDEFNEDSQQGHTVEDVVDNVEVSTSYDGNKAEASTSAGSNVRKSPRIRAQKPKVIAVSVPAVKIETIDDELAAINAYDDDDDGDGDDDFEPNDSSQADDGDADDDNDDDDDRDGDGEDVLPDGTQKVSPPRKKAKTGTFCRSTNRGGGVRNAPSLKADPSNPQSVYACDTCGKVFPTRRKYARHMREVNHTKSLPKCVQCMLTFDSMAEKEEHKRTAHSEQICDICGVAVKSHELKAHMRVKHKIGVDIYKCTYENCGKEFVKKMRWRYHMNSHMGLKPYTCEVCNKAFASKNTMREHWNHCARGESKPNYQCDICGEVLHSRGNLSCHKRSVHLGERYTCNICGIMFKYQNSLCRHRRLKNHYETTEVMNLQDYSEYGVFVVPSDPQ